MKMPNFDPTAGEFNKEVVNWEIEHEDVFHLKNLYKYMHKWLIEKKYLSVDGDKEKFETLYFHKVLNNGNVEHHIWWRVQKTPDKNPYLKYFVRLDFQTLNMAKHKTDGRGVKGLGTNKGDLIIRCTGWLMLDYDRSWRDNKYFSIIHRMFLRRIYRKQVEYYESRLYGELYELQSMIKQYMNLKNPYERPKSFHPDLGL